MLTPLEQLEQQIYDAGIELIERRPRRDLDALYIKLRGRRPRIYIDPAITLPAARYVILAEELGHHYTTTGDILTLDTPDKLRQERAARIWAIHKCAPYAVILQMLRQHYYMWEIAEWLYLPMWFLKTACEYYGLNGYTLAVSDEYASA